MNSPKPNQLDPGQKTGAIQCHPSPVSPISSVTLSVTFFQHQPCPGLPSPNPLQHHHPLPTLTLSPICPLPTRTGGTRARPRSGGQPWGGNRRGRGCGSGRRSGAVGGVRRASWPGGPSWPGSFPRRRSTACAAAGPRCTPSPAPAVRAAAGQRQLGTGGCSGTGPALSRDRASGGMGQCPVLAGLSQPGGNCVLPIGWALPTSICKPH